MRRGLEPKKAKRGSPNVARRESWKAMRGSTECGVSISAPRNNTYEKRPSYGGRFRLSKNLGELERAAALSTGQCPAPLAAASP